MLGRRANAGAVTPRSPAADRALRVPASQNATKQAAPRSSNGDPRRIAQLLRCAASAAAAKSGDAVRWPFPPSSVTHGGTPAGGAALGAEHRLEFHDRPSDSNRARFALTPAVPGSHQLAARQSNSLRRCSTNGSQDGRAALRSSRAARELGRGDEPPSQSDVEMSERLIQKDRIPAAGGSCLTSLAPLVLFVARPPRLGTTPRVPDEPSARWLCHGVQEAMALCQLDATNHRREEHPLTLPGL